LADTDGAQNDLGYCPQFDLAAGLDDVMDFFAGQRDESRTADLTGS
jgi:hypothetical protein